QDGVGPRPFNYTYPDHDVCNGAALYGSDLICTGTLVVPQLAPIPSFQSRFLLRGGVSFTGETGQEGRSLAVLPNGLPVVAGTIFARYTSGGVDPNFRTGEGGFSVAVQPDGKILLAGHGLRRYLGG